MREGLGMMDAFSDRYSVQVELSDVDLSRSAVIVVDMVNDFCSPGGAMVLPNADRLYEPIRRLTDGFRASGRLVVWIRDEHPDESDLEFRKRAVHCLRGSWGSELVPELAPAPGDQVLTKSRFSAFFGTDLDAILRRAGIQTVLLCGVVTNICVRSTAHDAFFLGYDVVVAKDACAGTADREQDSSLWDIQTHFGLIGTVDDLLAQLATSLR